MAKKPRLGRGLDSLIPDIADEAASERAEGVREVPLKKIELNPKQPRVDMDEQELEQLAESIRHSGLIQPILVRPAGEAFELVAGERRIRAAHMAGLEAVPAVVREVPDEKMLELALIENIQRADLNAIEKAKAVRQMIDELEITQQEAGSRLGLQRSTVSNLLRLLDLTAELQEMVSRETLTAGHARALLSLESEPARIRLARKVASKGLSVRETERIAAAGGPKTPEARAGDPSPNVARLEEGLSEALGTRVEVKPRKRGGRIIVHFGGNEEFERLYEALTGEDTLEYPALSA